MKTATMVVALTMWASAALAQTNPCTPPANGQPVVNPRVLYTESIGHNNVDMNISEYILGVFLEGVDPTAPTSKPVSSITIPKSAFTAVTGFANCYRATPAELLAIPVGQRYKAAIKTRRVQPDVVESAWSPLTPDPFYRPAAPPAAPTGIRLQP